MYGKLLRTKSKCNPGQKLKLAIEIATSIKRVYRYAGIGNSNDRSQRSSLRHKQLVTLPRCNVVTSTHLGHALTSWHLWNLHLEHRRRSLPAAHSASASTTVRCPQHRFSRCSINIVCSSLRSLSSTTYASVIQACCLPCFELFVLLDAPASFRQGSLLQKDKIDAPTP
jgi:hypothetical protein